jgi:excinuclease ABC subunit B
VVDQYSETTKKKLGEDGAIRLEDLPLLITTLEKDMKDLAKTMEFEKAAKIRDEITALRQLLGTSDGRIGVDKRKNRRMLSSRR